MNQLNDFFETERKRTVNPDPFFTKRVIARLDERPAQEVGIWDTVLNSARPVLALALMLIFCFVAVEMFVPQLPQHGMIESFLEPDQSPESFLYTDTDLPSRQDVLEQLIGREDDR